MGFQAILASLMKGDVLSLASAVVAALAKL
jgi:hypothetical protein